MKDRFRSLSAAQDASILRWVTNLNQDLSRWFDAKFVASFLRQDGGKFFDLYLREYSGYRQGITVVDVGSGKHPAIPIEIKERFGLRIVGLDISEDELCKAPEGYYDDYIVANIMDKLPAFGADLVVTRFLLEHVEDNRKAMLAIATLLKPGGELLCMVPSRNALFARINLMFPERLKRQLLFSLFPEKERTSGLKAYYNRCTPRNFKVLFKENGLVIEEEYLFYQSSYFSFFFPLYLLWRAWVVLGWLIDPQTFAETFVYRVRKP